MTECGLFTVWNIDETLNSQQTAHYLPRRMSYELSLLFGEKFSQLDFIVFSQQTSIQSNTIWTDSRESKLINIFPQ